MSRTCICSEHGKQRFNPLPPVKPSFSALKSKASLNALSRLRFPRLDNGQTSVCLHSRSKWSYGRDFGMGYFSFSPERGDGEDTKQSGVWTLPWDEFPTRGHGVGFYWTKGTPQAGLVRPSCVISLRDSCFKDSFLCQQLPTIGSCRGPAFSGLPSQLGSLPATLDKPGPLWAFWLRGLMPSLWK